MWGTWFMSNTTARPAHSAPDTIYRNEMQGTHMGKKNPALEARGQSMTVRPVASITVNGGGTDLHCAWELWEEVWGATMGTVAIQTVVKGPVTWESRGSQNHSTGSSFPGSPLRATTSSRLGKVGSL